MDHRPDQPVAPARALAHGLAGAPAGLFATLGRGAVPVTDTLDTLDERGYDGWPVLEQDTAITADEPAVTSASMLAAQESIAFLNSAHRTEEINR